MGFDRHAAVVVNTALGVLRGPGGADGGYGLGWKAEGGTHEEDAVNAAYDAGEVLGLVVIELRWADEMRCDENMAYRLDFWQRVGVPRGRGWPIKRGFRRSCGPG